MGRRKEKISTEDIDIEQYLKDLEAERQKIREQARKYKAKLDELRERWLFLTERGLKAKEVLRVLRKQQPAKEERD